MKKTVVICVISAAAICLSAFSFKGPVNKIHSSDADSVLADRKHFVDELRLAIKGRENSPADSVFKNIKILKGVPAGRLISIMDKGWANSLGVTCSHCHENGHWEVEVKAAKDITRQMVAMSATINTQLLKNITGLKNANPIVNCTTCHRGAVKPALNMSMPVAAK